MLSPDRLLDRELSWLAFNERVLTLAADRSLPLLERVAFCAIFGSNLDEFFEVRVAGLKDQLDAFTTQGSGDEGAPRSKLEAIGLEVGGEGGHDVRRYCHVATGNYNATTARIYEDIGVFSCDPVLADDLSRLFNALTGYGTPATSDGCS